MHFCTKQILIKFCCLNLPNNLIKEATRKLGLTFLVTKEIKQAITYGQWVKEGKITKEENALLIKELLKKTTK